MSSIQSKSFRNRVRARYILHYRESRAKESEAVIPITSKESTSFTRYVIMAAFAREILTIGERTGGMLFEEK